MEGVSGRHPPGQTPPPPDGHCSGRYASYWNAFLFQNMFETMGFHSPHPKRIPGYFQNMFETMGGLIVKQIIECNVLKHTYRKENNTVPKLVNIQLATTNHLSYQE